MRRIDPGARDAFSKRGMEVFEIKPVILGGSPSDPANKVMLTRDEHIKAVVYWNGVIAELRARRIRHQ